MPTSTVSVEGSSATSSAGSKGVVEPALPGTQIQSGPWKVQVENVRLNSRLPDGTKAPAGKQFMMVDLAFQNTGLSAALGVFPKQFTLRDASGAAIKQFPSSLPAFNARSIRPVAAGMGQNTTMVYAIPTGSGNYTLTFAPGQGANKTMAWLVP
jgi:hypothetical protein